MQEVINGGGLLPEFLPIWMWTSYLSETYTGNEHFIFDGVARKKLEAGVLDGALQFYNRGICDVISLTLSTEEATKRLLARGRKDDSEEEIRRRLAWYETNVQPTMEFFKNNPLYRFHDINGERSVEEIHRDILEKVF
jgi:adenylate kinase